MLADRLDHFDAFEFVHSRRDETTLVHGGAPCRRVLISVRLKGQNRTFLTSPNRTLLKSSDT
jgi:hypothetical protein